MRPRRHSCCHRPAEIPSKTRRWPSGTPPSEPAGDDRPLEGRSHIPADVKFEARTVGASPILTVEATAKDPTVAQDSAQDMAEAFRDDTSTRSGMPGKSRRSRTGKPSWMRAGQARTRRTGESDGAHRARGTQHSEGRHDRSTTGAATAGRRGQGRHQILFQFAARVLGGLVLGVLAALGLSALSNRVDEPRPTSKTRPASNRWWKFRRAVRRQRTSCVKSGCARWPTSSASRSCRSRRSSH